jgi:hypothetical protein
MTSSMLCARPQEFLESSACEAGKSSGSGPFPYEAFGLGFRSSEPIPGAFPAEPRQGTGIEICTGRIPDAIPQPEYADATVQINDRECLITLPEARLHIDREERVVVERTCSVQSAAFWGPVLSTAVSIIGLRRGDIPLHASVVVGNGVPVALAGPSGAGKSTTAAALICAGYHPHADDLCLLQMGFPNAVMVGSGLPEVRLWDDAASELGWPGHDRTTLVAGIPKAQYRLSLISARTVALRRIYALEFATDSTHHGIRRLSGFDAMVALTSCLRLRNSLLTKLSRLRVFEGFARISREVDVFRFSRPFGRQTIKSSISLLQEHMLSPAHTGE